MRRSICFIEPAHALAGERNTWRFVYTTSVALPKGTIVRFDLGSKGRSIDWEIPTANLKEKAHLIWLEDSHGKILSAKETEREDTIVPFFDFKLAGECKAGESFTICLGCMDPSKSKKNGSRAQQNIQRRRPFYVSLDTTGKGNWSEPEMFGIDVKGNTLKTIRLLTPSLTVKNKRFDIIVRFEDEFGNLTNNAPENTLIELTHKNLRDSLSWKLFLPETGYLTLPNLYFNEVGVYTIQLKNLSTGECFSSAPIKCLPSDTKHIFWGLLHGESERFDSTENIENCLRHFRDENAFAFFATSSPDTVEETSPNVWKTICQNSQEFNEEERFCTILGQQWVGEPELEGVRIFLYAKDDRPLLRRKEARTSSLKKIYKSFMPKELISIPTFTMADSCGYNFSEFDPEYERVVEIYNAWGSSECSQREKNSFPIRSSNKGGAKEYKEGSCLHALMQNKRFGFVAGGLDDRGPYADLYDVDQQQYSPGLTAILADSLSRQELLAALYNRNTYATTGPRIILSYSLAQMPMGSELKTDEKPGLAVVRHISGFVAGTSEIESLEIIRNGLVVHTLHPRADQLEFTWDDLEPLEKISLKDPTKGNLFTFYYIRVLQKDGHMAWGSPIWIDFIKDGKTKLKKEPIKTKSR